MSFKLNHAINGAVKKEIIVATYIKDFILVRKNNIIMSEPVSEKASVFKYALFSLISIFLEVKNNNFMVLVRVLVNPSKQVITVENMVRKAASAMIKNAHFPS